MLTVNVPNKLSGRINEMAKLCCQTPEEYLIEIIEERIAHDSAYQETAYLAESQVNRKRLNEAIEEIKSGQHKSHGLINENN
jgi:predicted DNA-binding protein